MFTRKSSVSYRYLMFALILALVAGLFGGAVQPAAAAGTLALSIVGVEKGKSVAIQVQAMPANKEFRVRMNEIGTKGVDGPVAGTAKTDKNGEFMATFPIPSKLADKSTIAIRIEATDSTGWHAYNWFYNKTSGTVGSTSGGGSGGGTTAPNSGFTSGNITIFEVKEDISVTVEVRKAPAYGTLTVWMDWKNGRGQLLPSKVGTIKADAKGVVDATFTMPRAVKDRRDVRLRLESTGSDGYVAYAWFLNANSDEHTGSGAPANYDGGIPYLLITAVKKNESVTLEARNFPTGDYEVSMGRMGTQGRTTTVGTVKVNKAGPFSVTVNIPADLKDRERIAIRVKGGSGSNYYAFTWFYNTTSP